MMNFIFYYVILVMGVKITDGLSLLIGNATFFEILTVKHAVIGMKIICAHVATFSKSIEFVFPFCSFNSTSDYLGGR